MLGIFLNDHLVFIFYHEQWCFSLNRWEKGGWGKWHLVLPCLVLSTGVLSSDLNFFLKQNNFFSAFVECLCIDFNIYFYNLVWMQNMFNQKDHVLWLRFLNVYDHCKEWCKLRTKFFLQMTVSLLSQEKDDQFIQFVLIRQTQTHYHKGLK